MIVQIQTDIPFLLDELPVTVSGLECKDRDGCGWKGAEDEAAFDGTFLCYICPLCGANVRYMIFQPPVEWLNEC